MSYYGREMTPEEKAEQKAAKKAERRAMTILVSAVVITILAIITLFSSMRFVGTGEVGVVTQYGRVTGRELTEGFSWVLPWGLNSVTKYDIKVQKEQTEGVAAATKDLQDTNATVVLNYQLERGKVSNIHQSIGKTYDDKLIAPATQEVFKAATANYTAAETITQRPALKADVVAALKDRLEPYGITVLDVSLTNFAFSEAFNDAIEQTQIANQEVIKAKNELEKAKVDAEREITKAKAAAEAQRLQQQTLTDELLEKQWIEKWDGKLPTYVGDGANFYIPAGK